MELKLTLQGAGTNEELRSNRTFMELKCYSGENIHQNLNSSNRTFMELKYKMNYRIWQEQKGSNRTFMELKLRNTT